MLKGRHAYTGIDAGSHSVKLVRLESRDGVLRVSHWGIEPVAANGNDPVTTRGEALSRLMKRIGFKSRSAGRVAACLCGREVSVRQVDFPRLSPEEVARALPFESRKHLPLENVTDPVLDFQILPATEETAKETMPVLLAAAPREIRDNLLTLLHNIGMEPDVIDVHPLPAVNAVVSSQAMDANRCTGILDLGGESIVLATSGPHGRFHSRTLTINGADLFSQEPDPTSTPNVPPRAMDALIREIVETVRFLNSRDRDHPMGDLHLCGGGASIDGLRDRLTKTLGISVAVFDPFAGRPVEGDNLPDAAEKAQLVSAVGLASWWGSDV